MVGPLGSRRVRGGAVAAGAALLLAGCSGETMNGSRPDGGARSAGGGAGAIVGNNSEAGPDGMNSAGSSSGGKSAAGGSTGSGGSASIADAAPTDAGTPACPPGAKRCGNVCLDVQYDPKNCGACGKACPLGELCSAGVCGTTCFGGSVECGGRCVDTQNDPANCGSCAQACDSQSICSRGACVLGCTGGTTECLGRCVDLRTDVTACGSCSTTCHVGEYCSSGICTPVCPAPLEVCNGACTDTSNDSKHCGSCDVTCPAGLVCSNGGCDLNCAGGTTRCGDACVRTNSDPANCGTCGKACLSTEYCLNGVCAGCPPNQTACDSGCVDLLTNSANCGKCGGACPFTYYGTTSCTNGTCTTTCSSGYATCSADYLCGTFVSNDVKNCGSCGHACAANELCEYGTCKPCGPGLTNCSGYCTDLQTSYYSCGACNAVCQAPYYSNEMFGCVAGVCQSTGCYPGNGDCNNDDVDGCEAYLSSDRDNCGACGKACAPDRICTGGVCAACGAGQTACDNACVDLQSSATNCGACGKACSGIYDRARSACASGSCVFTCDPGFLNCDGSELNGCEAAMDSKNCGSCGSSCAQGQFCSKAACIPCSPVDLGSVVPVSLSSTTVRRPDSFATVCGSSGRGDAYFSFKAPSAASYSFTVVSSAGTVALEAHDGSCGGPYIKCIYSYSPEMTLSLTTGQTVILVVEHPTYDGDFTLTVR